MVPSRPAAAADDPAVPADGAAVVTGKAPRRQTIDQVLARARRRLRRMTPAQALAAMRGGAVLVDIRPHAQRAAEGEIPGALIVERNVLEWRFDPASEFRLAEASYQATVIVVCSQGYTSSLAAVSLQELGVRGATDLEGGFQAWASAGLPVQPGGRQAAAVPDRTRGEPEITAG